MIDTYYFDKLALEELVQVSCKTCTSQLQVFRLSVVEIRLHLQNLQDTML